MCNVNQYHIDSSNTIKTLIIIECHIYVSDKYSIIGVCNVEYYN